MADYIIQKAIDRKDMSAKQVRLLPTRRYEVQPKYDGCHMVAALEADGNHKGYSATGEVVRSCDHILKRLAEVFASELPIVVPGEVWKRDTPFPEISGAFRRHSPQPDLLFAPFDMLRPVNGALEDGGLEDPQPYHERVVPLRVAATYFEDGGPILPLLSYPFYDWDETLAYAIDLKNQGGYDGAILRDIDAGYIVGRCRAGEVVKVKPLVSLDLLVIGVKLALGEKTGKHTAALEVQLKDGKRGFVSTGLRQEEIDHIYQHDGAGWKGSIVQVDAMGWTEDGLLREPRFIAVRHDKVAPDF